MLNKKMQTIEERIKSEFKRRNVGLGLYGGFYGLYFSANADNLYSTIHNSITQGHFTGSYHDIFSMLIGAGISACSFAYFGAHTFDFKEARQRLEREDELDALLSQYMDKPHDNDSKKPRN